MIVDFEYYQTVYMGQEADEASFPALNAHAERIIGAMARWQVTESSFPSLSGIIQTMYKLAICSQVDFLSLNGIDSINSTGNGGFTVGKVTVRETAKTEAGGAMSGNISPEAIMYLEQSGLLNPAVPVVIGGGVPC